MPTLTPDDDRELREVSCRRCATTVLVLKNSAEQTAIQWLDDVSTCTELAEHRAAGVPTARVPACRSLRASIEEAVDEGALEVLDR